MPCPKCKSDEWKLASLVHSEGLTVHKNSSTGVGVSTGGVGVGSSKEEGVSQTAISKLAAPPTSPGGALEGLVFFGVLIISVIFFAELNWNKWISIFLSIVLGFFAFLAVVCSPWSRKKFSDYEEQYANWSKKRMCLRCGIFYSPEADESSST